MNNIRNLLDSICLLAETYKKIEMAKGEGYNIFRVIDMTANETSVHSAFLADLLSPKGLHGMGDVFLRLFIEQIGLKTDFMTEKACVEREKYIGTVTKTTGGRLDILIDDTAGKSIIIENKIYATDQENQLIRYSNYAKSAYKNRDNYTLLYLSLDGEVHDEEKTASILTKGKDYTTISYGKDIVEWLEHCKEKVVDKPLIREGVSHYINLIKYLTNHTLSKEMEKEMLDLILNNADYIRNIRVIKDAVELVEIKLQERFWHELKSQMEKAGYEVVPEPVNSSNYYNALEKGRIRNFYKKSKDCHYGFEFKIGEYKGATIYYAIRKHNPLICGILARRNENLRGDDNRKPISSYDDYFALQKVCGQLAFNLDVKGWYLGYKDVRPRLNFKELDDATLERLTNVEDTVKDMVKAAITEIESIQVEIGILSR